MRSAAVALWEFVWKDPVGRWLGVMWAIVAWFALTWMSLPVLITLVVTTAIVIATQRKRRDLVVEDDLEDIL